MSDTILYERIKLRLKKHGVLYRKPLPLKKYEKAILGIIASNFGELGYIELGRTLGFAVENVPEQNIRFDKAEQEIFEVYLSSLNKSHLLVHTTEAVRLTDWGLRALKEDHKFGFFKGSLQIPEFFDILCAESFVIPSWMIGLAANVIDTIETDLIWPSLSEPEDANKEYDFFEENYKGEEDISIDSFEPTDDFSVRFVELKFAMNGDELLVFYNNERIEFMETLLNSPINSEKKSELKRKIELKHYIDTSPELTVGSLSNYLDLLGWDEIIQNVKFSWNEHAIHQLAEWGISWLDISEHCPIDDLFASIERFKEEVDWTILSKRCENDLILSTLDKYDWNLETLLSRLTLDEFREHFEKIVLFEGIDLDPSYLELDDAFIIDNIEKLPGITDLIINRRHGLLSKLLPEYKHLDWNWERFSSAVPLSFIIENIQELMSTMDINTVLTRVFKEADTISDDALKILLDHASEDYDYMLNRHTKLKLSLSQLELLDQRSSIYWGNEQVNGFEMNPNQVWTSDMVSKSTEYWSYPAAEEFISSTVRDLTELSSIPVKWDLDALSLNPHLCGQPDFLIKNRSVLNWAKTINVLDVPALVSNFELIQLTEEFTLERLSDVLSSRLSLSNLIALSETNIASFYPLIQHLKWRHIVEQSSDKALLDLVVNKQSTFELFAENENFTKSISSRIPLDMILEKEELEWNWTIVTRNALKEGKIDEQLKDEFAHVWDWKTLLEKTYQPEQLLLENNLTEIATLISLTIDEENSKRAWRFITTEYPDNLIWNTINVTANIDIFKWDWDYLSSSSKMPMSIHTLEMYAGSINWDIFSVNTFLNRLFRNDKEMFSSRQVWEGHVLKYLERFKDKWHFDKLSLISSINGNIKIIEKFIEEWDWKVLSSDRSNLLTRGVKDKKGFDPDKLVRFKEKIDFEIISTRTDCTIDLGLIQRLSKAPWNWKLLSVNPVLNLNTEFFFEKFREKDWDWNALSRNSSLLFTNETLIELKNRDLDWSHFSQVDWLDARTIVHLKDKPWDWAAISRNNDLYFDAELLRLISDKQGVHWNRILRSQKLIINKDTLSIFVDIFDSGSDSWDEITQSKAFDVSDIELVTEFKTYLNWERLVSDFKLDFNDLNLLNSFEDRLNWLQLSQHNKFKPELPVLVRYRHQLNWYSITPKLNFSSKEMTENMVNELEDFLDWTHICSRANFKGSLKFVKKFYSRMDLYQLISNPSIDLETYNFLKEKIDGDVYSRFVYKLKEQSSPWSGFVYHFTHMTNAIEIIRSRKIYSRDRALIEAGHFSDAAGSVVHRKGLAHKFARFYFRPQTPTQFYNECLGKDIHDGRYFETAAKLGLPKCPVPVFFKFDLEEVFLLMSEKCFVSNGNMQRDQARIGAISEMFKKFNFEYLYSTVFSGFDNYKEGSQQEFLVQDFFDFSKLKKYEILVMNENDLAQLYKTFDGDNEILSKTRVARYGDEIFVASNKRINYSVKGKVLSVSTDYAGDGNNQGVFTLNLEHSNYRIIRGEPLYATKQSLTFYPNIEIEFDYDICFKLIFKDLVTKKEPWEIIKYCNVD